jgi:hypothetical protein
MCHRWYAGILVIDQHAEMLEMTYKSHIRFEEVSSPLMKHMDVRCWVNSSSFEILNMINV